MITGHEVVWGTPAHERVRRPLGYAVHPNAIERLLAIWPEARVSVCYSRWDGRRTTHVEVFREGDPLTRERGNSPSVIGMAACSLDDQFSKAKGRDIAFRRALRSIARWYAADKEES